MILLSDTDVPRHALPALLRTVGDYLPLTHAAAAARELAAGTGLGEVLPLLGKEFLIGVGYAAAAAVLLKLFELESRRKATLDTILAKEAARLTFVTTETPWAGPWKNIRSARSSASFPHPATEAGSGRVSTLARTRS